MNHRSPSIKLLTLFLLGLTLQAPGLNGHGEEPPRLSEGSEAKITKEIPGLDAFVEGIRTNGQFQFTAGQLAELGEVERHLMFAKEIREKQDPDYSERDALYNRSLAQASLLHLLEEEMPDLVKLDFTTGTAGHDVMNVIELPALEGTLFLKVVTGEGDPEFSVQQLNLKKEFGNGPYNLKVRENGTSYILVVLKEIPSDMSRLILTFSPWDDPEKKYWSGLSITSPETGQYRLEIRDETGEITPALVRLVHKPTGKLWAPPNAVDLWPIMTGIRGFPKTESAQPYMHFFLNMRLRGPYWVVPDPFEAALPEGEWELYVVHGIEYEPVIESFEVTSGGWSSEVVQLERWVDMPARGWYSGDDHIHARMMNSEDARDIMAFVRAADIKVGNILEMGDPGRTFYDQRGFGKHYRVEENGHVLVPGQEDPRSDFGHTIGLNLTRLARDLDKYMLNDWVADEIHRQGGLYGHTHVGEGGLGVHRDMTMLMPRGKSDFASIMQNVLGTERYYDFLNLGFKLAASAGSDTPYGGAVGITRLYAFIGTETPFSADAWFDSVRKGNTFVTNGPMLELHVEESMPGDTILLEKARSLRIRGRAWGLEEMSAPARLSVVRNGVVIKELQAGAPWETELSVDFETDSGNGCWIALMAQGMDGTQAHTTPVYIHREGFRHWNVQEAERLINERMGTLDEITELVQTQRERLAAGRISPLDFANILIGQQAPEVMERVQLVRNLYRELMTTLQKELDAAN